MSRNQRDITPDQLTSGVWTVTNHTADVTIDANGLVAVVADGLGSLIKQLDERGIISATVTA